MIETAVGQQCRAADGHCITCSDEGVLMWVTAIETVTATCQDDQGHSHQVAVDLVGPVAVGDRVLVHAGVAIG